MHQKTVLFHIALHKDHPPAAPPLVPQEHHMLVKTKMVAHRPARPQHAGMINNTKSCLCIIAHFLLKNCKLSTASLGRIFTMALPGLRFRGYILATEAINELLRR